MDSDIIGIPFEQLQFMFDTISPQSEFCTGAQMGLPPGQRSLAILIPEQHGPLGGGTAFLKKLIPWKESYDQPREHIKKQRHYFANKGLSSQGYGFSSGHVWMLELDCEES